MIKREVARKYAGALYLASTEKQLTSRVYEQLGGLEKIVEADQALLDFLKSPRVSEPDKKSFVATVFTNRLHPLLVQFLNVLIEKGRIKYLRDIIDEFNRKVEAELGVGRATVISATELTKIETERLAERLSAGLKLKIVLETEVDPAIMGGVIVITQNQIIDGSVRHGLDLIEQSLKKVRVA